MQGGHRLWASPAPAQNSATQPRADSGAHTRACGANRGRIHGLSYHTTITSAAVYGGVEMGRQERALNAGVDIIVATPGRLMDHMRQQNADLQRVELLVLDEADRMMDMGFWPDVRRSSPRPARVRRCCSRRRCPTRSCGSRSRLHGAQVRASRPAQRAGEDHHASRRSRRRLGKFDWLIEHLRHPAGPVLVFARPRLAPIAWRAACSRRHPLHVAACRSHAGSAAHRGRRLQGRPLQGAGGHRYRRSRPRHRRHPHRHQLRTSLLTRGLRASRRPDRPRG